MQDDELETNPSSSELSAAFPIVSVTGLLLIEIGLPIRSCLEGIFSISDDLGKLDSIVGLLFGLLA